MTTREPRLALHGTGHEAVPRWKAAPGTLRRTWAWTRAARRAGPKARPDRPMARAELQGSRETVTWRYGVQPFWERGKTEETLGEGRWSGVEGGGLQAEGHICDEKQDLILGRQTLPPGPAPVPSRTLLPFL